jgi:hypothetical protein
MDQNPPQKVGRALVAKMVECLPGYGQPVASSVFQLLWLLGNPRD